MVNANSGWLFTAEEIRNAPSTKEGMTNAEELECREMGCHLIWKIGIGLKLKENPTLATACTLFHRFYMVKTFQKFPYAISALGCLFLAGKVEETPKKCKDIVAFAREIDEEKFESKNLMNDVFTCERTLLATLGFDLYIENPYVPLINYARIFDIEKEKMSAVVQFAWTFLNNCVGTTLCIQYEPEIVAVSILEMSMKFHSLDTNHLDFEGRQPGVKWHALFIDNLEQSIIESLCHFALDFYENKALFSVHPTPLPQE